MYNTVTEEKIKNIPFIKGIDSSRLPQELTRIFSEIASIRKEFSERSPEEINDLYNKITLLRKLANNLETFVVGFPHHDKKEAAAFVAGTAHNLLWNISKFLLGRNTKSLMENIFNKDFISSEISAIILFIIGNSLADAAELANKIFYEDEDEDKNEVSNILFECIKNLAIGKLTTIINTEIPNVDADSLDNDDKAISILWRKLCYGIKQLANNLLDPSREQRVNYFQEVISLSYFEFTTSEFPFQQQSIFSGPLHLAKLLELLENDLLTRGIINIPPPINVDETKWLTFIKNLAKTRPYLWENHFTAIKTTNFLNPGNSAVLTFPTGAGKSTLAELKIASALFNKKSVIYIVPTHALEDQVNENLKNIFPDLNVNFSLNIDSEFTEIGLGKLTEINVMTPERCLTLFGVKQELFDEIGLIVFDEFHLIHGKPESIDRRNLDAMYCLLLLLNKVSIADYFLISAMVENGKEISDWLSAVTERPCFSLNSTWKPTRQIHGCIIYDKKQVNDLEDLLRNEKLTSTTKAPTGKFKRKLLIEPICLFSLINMWDSNSAKDYHFINNLLEHVNLSATINSKTGDWYLTPNKLDVASAIAAKFILMGLKVLIFVDNPKNTIATAEKISKKISSISEVTKNLYENYQPYLQNLSLELGKEDFAFLSKDNLVGVHHGNMLPKERFLCENLFKKKEGLRAIVATPTIAQGINLPAEVVIIAGDDRYDYKNQIKAKLAPYEILNTAGRAGRAGMSSQGVVIVIPGSITTLHKENKQVQLSKDWWSLKKDIFSKSDQCLIVNDPMEYLLDAIQNNLEPLLEAHKATIYRFNENTNKEFLSKSFYYFRSKDSHKFEFFDQKVQAIQRKKNELLQNIDYQKWVMTVSNALGLEPQIINEIGTEIDKIGIDFLCSKSILENLHILIDWISLDSNRIAILFSKSSSFENLLKILGIKKEEFEKDKKIPNFHILKNLLKAWITGETFEKINDLINTKKENTTDKHCNEARIFILKLIPEISFIFGLLSMIIKEKTIELGNDPKNIPLTISTISSCIREGFDDPNKLAFKYKNKHLSRIEVHRKYESVNLDQLNLNSFEELLNYF